MYPGSLSLINNTMLMAMPAMVSTSTGTPVITPYNTPGSPSHSQPILPPIVTLGDHPTVLQRFLKPSSISLLWNAESRAVANRERKAHHHNLKMAHHCMVILVMWHQVTFFYVPPYVLT